ncbi:MAG: hypothetical protein IPG67_08975 [Acidobacteria bacterium]|nr:hypothetical protein [Acidobacteriota bacterium]
MLRICAIVFTVMSLFNSPSASQEKSRHFWKWFKTKEARIFEFEKDRDTYLPIWRPKFTRSTQALHSNSDPITMALRIRDVRLQMGTRRFSRL